MKLKLISDLHLEFYESSGRSVVENLDVEDADVVVIAGDLCPLNILPFSIMNLLSDKCNQLIYVMGNHEHYHSSLYNALAKFEEIDNRYSNIHCLQNKEVTIGDVSFAGTTLWYKIDTETPTYSNLMNDFHAIPLFNDWINSSDKIARRFLANTESDVWVTHHLPSWQAVHPKYEGSCLNRFFVNNIEDLIAEKNPQLLLHGHTHEPFAYMVNNTEVYCNPMGYPSELAKKTYSPKEIII